MATPKKEQASTTNSPSPEPGLRFFRDILGQDWVVSHLKTAMLAAGTFAQDPAGNSGFHEQGLAQAAL